MKFNFKQVFFDWVIPVFVTILGTCIAAAGIHYFLLPTTISPGGVSGASIIINKVSGIPVQWMNLIINVPLFIFGAKLLGKRCAILTLISTLVLSIALELFSIFAKGGIPNLYDDMMLAAIFGGVSLGLGLGMVFKVGATTGGTDLAGAIISKYFPTFSIAKGMAAIDLIIVILTGVVTKIPQTSFYSLITIFFCMRLSDMIVDGFDYFKGFMIISKDPEKLGTVLMNELSRGVTVLKGAGMYSKKEKLILLCVIHRAQFTKARDLIYKVDENAFIMILDMKEVIGQGFLPFKPKE
ncbi:MAG: YitT family protein [Treponemataceae bacterium]